MPISTYESAMKNIVIVVIVVCSSLGVAPAQNSDGSGSRSSILALEHAWDQAQENGDVKALAAIFDNALIYVDYDGKLLTKAEYMARVKANNTHIHQIVAEEMSVQMFGDTAIVVGTYRAKGIENGKPYLRRGRFTDTWILKGSNWICIAAETTPILR
ncbi:MAG TPA: nuclear transport factor 2 family protein [Candidatus Sulfotelmatobacter sp.]|nr:nuclear transport factor 2 family protein [Candidatus Sulfotelmatobacter sp.]